MKSKVERALSRAFKRVPGDSGPARPLHLNVASQSSALQMFDAKKKPGCATRCQALWFQNVKLYTLMKMISKV